MTLNGHFREEKKYFHVVCIFKMQVVVISSNFGTNSLFSNFFFNLANLEFYQSLSEYCLLIGRKEICKKYECTLCCKCLGSLACL